MDDMKQRTDLPSELKDFCKRYDEKREDGCAPAGAHNLYLVQSIDRDGNIVDTKYGMNLMTDFGFNFRTTAGNNNRMYNLRLYIGTGTKVPEFTDTTLDNRLATPRAQITTSVTICPMKFDPLTGVIYQSMYVGEFTYDYNISGINEDKQITEIGLTFSGFPDYDSQDYNRICTRTLIYDDQGQPSYIEKKLDQKLTIKVYFGASFLASMITSAWTRGYYMAMCPYVMLPYNGYLKAFVRFANLYMGCEAKPNPVSGYSGGISHSTEDKDLLSTMTPISEGSRIRYQTCTYGKFMFTNPYEYFSEALYKFSYRSLVIDEHDKLPEPEELTSEYVYTNSVYDTHLDYTFGKPHKDIFEGFTSSTSSSEYQLTYILSSWNAPDATQYGEFPVIDFNMTSCKMYNFKTDAWDIDESNFTNAPNAWYGNSMIEAFETYMADHEGVNRWVRVFINTHTNIPIKKLRFYNTGVRMVATNAYWDTSQWHVIENPSVDLPSDQDGVDLRCMKYYIDITDKLYCMYPEYIQTVHKINPQHEPRVINTPRNDLNGYYGAYALVGSYDPYGHVLLSSDKNNWIAGMNYIIYPDLTDPTGESDQSIKFCTHINVYNTSSINDTNFYASSICRYATDDFIVVMHCARNKYNTTDGNIHSQFNAFRIFRVYDNYTDTLASIQNPIEMAFPVNGNNTGDAINFLLSWSEAGFLLCQERDTNRGSHYLKLYDGQDGMTPTIYTLDDARCAQVICGTTMCVYTLWSNDRQVCIYDMDTHSLVTSFEIPEGLSLYTRRYFGFGNNVYIRVQDANNVQSTLLYLIAEEKLVHLNNWVDENQVESIADVFNNKRLTAYKMGDANRIQARGGVIGNDKVMITSGCGSVYDRIAYLSNIYFYDKPESPRRLYNVIKENRAKAIKGYYQNTEPASAKQVTLFDKITYTADGKHLVWLRNFIGQRWNTRTGDMSNRCDTGPGEGHVIDVGYLVNGHIQDTCAERQAGAWDSRSADSSSGSIYRYTGGICQWKNGIVWTWTDGEMHWSPIECWLPHKVTGTTRTIQSYNNPRSFTNKQFKIYVTNDTSITEVPPGQ